MNIPHFIECSVPTFQSFTNFPVNLGWCKTIHTGIVEKYFVINFIGCDTSWWFGTEEARNKEYIKILKDII